MEKIRNEKGYALLLVMLLVVLFTIMGMGLLAMNMNAAKQFDLKEEQVQARHQAEMGVLHYQSELNKYVFNNRMTITDAVAFCNTVPVPKVESGTSTKKYTTILLKNECEIKNGEIVLKLESTGEVGERGNEVIEADLYLTNSTGVPTLPIPTGNEPVRRSDPGCIEKENGNNCLTTVEEFSDIPILTLQKGEYIFGNHLILNNLKIGGGNDSTLIVRKDLYIRKSIHSQNHTCLIVQGSLSLLNETYLENETYFGNKTYIFVYGDVNLFDVTAFQTRNSGIYINGDVYIKGKKIDPKPTWASSFPVNTATKDGCNLPGYGYKDLTKWRLIEKINATYK
ncbi:hypothetical protein Plano_1144 [Planococcus sp. PAMC 21323]|uniref:hypothetical protein n=1 Tax=Planococcus sp. PAMC 21323 TaxID=1526927 RepID=UPI00056E4177|nr:hypothetical protein [Planococcus sp. PAMC 21323]AIY05109.1 hypothetical protein Plano_1144 [Planococcus sp. PAMC 21323]